MDKRGFTDVKKAKEYYEKERSYLVNEPSAYLRNCAEYCFTYEEALSMRGDNMFNKLKLSEQLMEVEVRKSTPKIERGRLEWVKRPGSNTVVDVKWYPDINGKIEIIEGYHPSPKDKEFVNLYIAGIDSIDVATSNSAVGGEGSKFCILIKKRFVGLQGDLYVAKYLERPDDERDAYDNARKLLWYYGCRANLEDTKTNIKTYFRDRSDGWRFIERPRSVISESAKGSRLVGTPASVKAINHGLNLVKNYVDDSCNLIYFQDILEQLMNYKYEDKGRFDIVAAMQMTEIFDEELSTTAPVKKISTDDEWEDLGYYYENGVKKYGVIENNNNVKLFNVDDREIDYIDAVTSKIRWVNEKIDNVTDEENIEFEDDEW